MACTGAGVAAVAAPAGTAAVTATGFAAAAVGAVAAGGAAPEPHAASRLAPVAETSMVSAERRLALNRFRSSITSLPPEYATMPPPPGSGQSAATPQLIASAQTPPLAPPRPAPLSDRP